MAIAIASKKIKTNNNIKFKCVAATGINEITTNYSHICAIIVFGKKRPIIEKQLHIQIVQLMTRKYKTLKKETG